MGFFQKLAHWMERESSDENINDIETAIVKLEALLTRLRADSGLFDEIVNISEQDGSEVVDLAKMLELLNNPDDFMQEQGIQLLLTYNSEEAWQALMTGVSFPFEIAHSSLRMSPALHRILLKNPFYDYSGIKSLKISTPFADNLEDVTLLTELEELHLCFASDDKANLPSLQGLQELKKLTKLVVTIERPVAFSFADPNWTNFLQNVEEIEFKNKYYRVSTVDYAITDALPNLKKISFCGVEISYANATFVNQPELHIHSKEPDGYRDGIHYSGLLPKQSVDLKINTLYLCADSAGPKYGMNLGFLQYFTVEKLLLDNVMGVYGLSVFANLSHEPEITYVTDKMQQGRFWLKKYHEKTWPVEILQQYGVENVKVLLEQKELRRATAQKLLVDYTGTIEWSSQYRIPRDFQQFQLKEVIFSFPEREGHLAPSFAARLFGIVGTSHLPTSVEKIQYGKTNRVNDNWMTSFGDLKHLTNLKEVVLIKPVSLKTSDLEKLLEFPSIEKIHIIGGKKRKRIPKKLRQVVVYKES